MNNKKVINLFEHQLEMVQAAKDNDKGILVAPTGSGKTLAQAEIVADEIRKGGFRVILVKTPRILLSNQVANEYNSYLFNTCGLEREVDYDSILVHSGKNINELNEQDLTEAEAIEEWAHVTNQLSNAYTDRESVKNLLESARDEDIPFVIFTTYHSNDKAADVVANCGEQVELDINDEGHFLTQENFSTIFDVYEPKRQYFFTATMRVTKADDGRGMQNFERFGDVIYSMPIAEAIERKLILPICPITIRCEETVTAEQEKQAIEDLVSVALVDLAGKSKLQPKLLVATNGSQQIDRFINSNALRNLMMQHDDLHVLTVHSKKELITYNGVQITREEFDQLKDEIGSDDSKKMIMMHYDILSEGIDVAGLNGVLILRKMNEAKFLQTVGRCVRLYRKAPELKKFGNVYFPDLADKDIAATFDEMIAASVEAGYIPEELLNENLIAGKAERPEFIDDFDEEMTTRQRRLALFTQMQAQFPAIAEKFEKQNAQLLLEEYGFGLV